MLIDGFTLAAQIINFLILILLLRRFLYGPITRAMNERQAKIAAQVAEAEILKQRALDEAEAYRQQREELQDRREELLFEAREAAEAWRKEFLGKARKEIDESRASWHKSIEAEKQALTQEFRRGVSRQVCDISRHVLADLADTELEQQTLRVFLRRIQELDEHQRETLLASAQKSSNQVVLRSAFEISPADRQTIVQTIRQAIAPETQIHFEVSSDLLCGVELSIQDYKLAWTLDEYLLTLEARLFETLGENPEATHAG